MWKLVQFSNTNKQSDSVKQQFYYLNNVWEQHRLLIPEIALFHSWPFIALVLDFSGALVQLVSGKPDT